MSNNWDAELKRATDRAFWAAENGIPEDVPLLVSREEMAAAEAEVQLFALDTGRSLPKGVTRLAILGRAVEVMDGNPAELRAWALSRALEGK